jgi:hypothetical protein
MPASRGAALVASVVVGCAPASPSAFAEVRPPRLEIVLEGERGAPSGLFVRVEAPGRRSERRVDEGGRAVFLALSPGTYDVTVTGGPGEKPPRRCSATAVLPAGSDLKVVLRCASGAAVVMETPVPADARVEFDATSLRTRPRPADPWSVLREVPGVVLDRVNVGGSDTALSALLVSHGDPGTGAVWTFDGIDVTDPASLGSPLFFVPLDPLEAVVAQTGGADVRARTPGVQVALLSRAPGRPGGRLDARFASDALQADNLLPDLRDRSLFRSRTEQLLDLAAEAGGPVGQRLWLWGSASRYALDQLSFTGHDETLRSSTLAGRARLRLGSGSLSGVLLASGRTDDARDPVLDAAPEARWRQSGTTWLASLRDERDLGRLTLVSRIAWVDGGFRLEPRGGDDLSPFQDVTGVVERSYARFETDRQRFEAGAEGSARAPFGGFEHDLVLGVGYEKAPASTRQSWPGNGTFGIEQGGVFFRTFRLTGFAQAYRDVAARAVEDQWEMYLQDTARRGRLALTLGVRIDRLSGRNRPSAVPANPEFPAVLPAVRFGGGPPGFTWLDILPRVGAEVALDGRGRLSARARYAAYGAPLGMYEITFDNPLAEVASSTWYWIDRNGDQTVGRGELDTVRGQIATSGLDPDDPASASAPDSIDPSLRSPRTRELAAGISWAPGPALAIVAETSYRRLTSALWTPLLGVTSTDYVATGAVEGELLGTDYSRVFFAPANTSRLAPGYGRELRNRDGYLQESVTVTLDARGRALGRLDWRAWGAFMDWWERFPDRELSVQDPTPLEASPLQDFGRVVVRPGGLGREDLFVNARWMAGASLSGRLPLGFEAGLTVNARDGFPIPYIQVGSTGDPTAGSKPVLVAPTVDSYRLPPLVLADARLAHGFELGPGRLTLAADVFNLANSSTTLQVARDVELAGFNRARQIVRPRIVRLGLSWQF